METSDMEFHTFQAPFFIVNAIGASFTLISYVYCFMNWEFFVYRAKIANVFKGGLHWAWLLSIVSSTIAFLYITFYVGLTTDEKVRQGIIEQHGKILFAYVVFYIGAATYIPSVIIAVEEERCKSEIVLFSLFLTAVGVVTLTIYLFLFDYASSDGIFVARTFGVLVSWHCVFIDAYLWWSMWDPFPNRVEVRSVYVV